MGIFYPLLLCSLVNGVVLTKVSPAGLRGVSCFAFHKGRRGKRQQARPPLGPEERSRLVELEREVMSEQSIDTVSSLGGLHFDRDIGASYKAVKVNAAVEGESTTKSKDILAELCPNKIYEAVAPSPIVIHDDSETTIFDESLRAAKEWESNSDRFRNPACEVVNDITDDEMYRKARLEELREKQIGPSMRQLFATLQDEEPKKEDDEWRDLIPQFSIDVDITQCYGCGVHLQCNNKDGKGYVDPLVLKEVKRANGRPRCKRCSSMHSGFIFNDDSIALGESAMDASRETVSILRNALSLNESRNITIVYMMDALDMHFEDGLANLITARRNKRKAETHFYVVLNKVDLLPEHSRRRVLMYLHRFIQSRAPELKIKPRHIFLMSSLKGGGVNLFLSVLLEMAYRLRSKVFFVGATNSGKSTFLNRLSDFVSKGKDSGGKRKLLSTSVIPGTTLTPLRVDTGTGFNLYDTPGIVVPDSLSSYLTSSELKVAVPSSSGPRKPFRLGAGYSLLLGPFVRIDILEGRPFFFTPHFSKRVTVIQKRTDKVDAFLRTKPFGDVRMFYGTPKSTDEGESSEKSEIESNKADVETVQHYVRILGEGWEKATAELCIKGMGFVTIAGALQLHIRIETMSGTSVYMREPLMPYEGIPFVRKRLPTKQRKPSQRTLKQ